MSYFDRLPPEDQGWVRRMLLRVLLGYACLMMLLLAGAGFRIGVVEPIAQGWADLPKGGETDGRFVAAFSEPAARPRCAPRDCVSAALEAAPPVSESGPVWTIGATD